MPSENGIVRPFMSANQNPSSLGRKVGIAIGIVLAAVAVFVVVMCTGTTDGPGFLQPSPDMSAPKN